MARLLHLGRVRASAYNVADILPTILAAIGVSYPSELGGHHLQPLDGEGPLALLEGQRWSRSRPIFWEHEGNAAVRDGHIKLVRKFNQPWEVYDMDVDRTELHDLSRGNGAMLARLVAEYQGWAASVGVVDWNIH